MKKLLLAMIAVAALISFAACDHNETYADQRDRELDSINAFLRNENIKVIKEAEFEKRFEARKAGDKTVKLTDTDPNNNEYVLFESNGIYMQVINVVVATISPRVKPRMCCADSRSIVLPNVPRYATMPSH